MTTNKLSSYGFKKMVNLFKVFHYVSKRKKKEPKANCWLFYIGVNEWESLRGNIATKREYSKLYIKNGKHGTIVFV